MIKLLIVDDNGDKIQNIASLIREKYRDDKIQIQTASFVNDARRILASCSIDILILDICLPERAGDSVKRDAGINLLNQIKNSQRFTYPRYVIAVSEYEELTKEFSLDAGVIHTSIVYNSATSEWKTRMSDSIATAVSILDNNTWRRSYDYDVAVICALQEELELVKRNVSEVKECEVTDDDFIYHQGYIEKDGKKIKVVMAQSTQMGMVPAAVLATKIINNFAPRYLVMTGITAGISGKVNYGDIIAAEYSWDYGAGKETVVSDNSVHMNTIQQITIDTSISTIIRRVSNDSAMLNQIKKDFMGNKPDHELRLHLGPVASGAAVIADPNIVARIKENQIRDVIGIEMEIFGLYYAAKWAISPKPKFLALKSVCDFADEKKNDEYHQYASYTSAKVFLELAKNHFSYE